MVQERTVNTRVVTGLMLGLFVLTASCAAPSDALFGPVGPEPLMVGESTLTGYLKVHTATEVHPDGDTFYFPHTSYSVYSGDGKTVVKKVANAISIHDEDPSLVQLSAGKYIVVAKAEHCGMVKIRVIIEPGQLTTLDLQDGWKQHTSYGRAPDPVRLPNGQVVGWRATVTTDQNH